MTLVNKKVLVVGGTSGLGQAVARLARDRGASVIVASRRQASVDRALEELGPGVTGRTIDVLDDELLTGLAVEIGQVDHLVYTAGEPLQTVMLPELTADVIRRFWMTRFDGAVATIRALTRADGLAASGSVVLTSGNAAQRPGPGWALGAAVCGAVDALTRQLALELAPIRVNNVAPGVTKTPLWSSLSPDEQEALYDGVASTLPVGRIADADDVARAYVYAMEQPMATGTSILVDGGAVLV
jgi:NAD(P)-dependent dehydrogenase (short-subunit alcohol dehydrogenase family)